MAPSDELAQRIRAVLDGRDGVTEGDVFGAIGWMVNGNVACGVTGEDLLLRVDRYDLDRFLATPHVQPMKRGKRTMKGFVIVGAGGIADDADLARWIDVGAAYAAWLPPKEPA